MFAKSIATRRLAVVGLSVCALCALVAYPQVGQAHALTATAPSLGTAASFAVLGGSTVTNTGSSVISGDVGVSPGSAVVGFPPGVVVGGAIHAGDATASLARADTGTAY